MEQLRSLSIILAALALLGLAPVLLSRGAGRVEAASPYTRVPPGGFIGISPQGPTTELDYELMQLAGITSVRLPLSWKDMEPHPYERFDPDWSGFDAQVALAAEHGMTVFPFIWGTPAWISPKLGAEPVNSLRQRREWLRFLRGAALRYGPDGRFWRENRDLPRRPVRQWEIWNEENIVTFSREPDPVRFARLIRISGRLLHRIDPGSKVILGGLFGRPLQVPPNVHSGAFLDQVYSVPGIKRYFDGVGLHPYVAVARAMRGQIETLRKVMRRHRDAGTPIYMTEIGWGSAGYESRWERGPRGQARELDRAVRMLTANRTRWRIGGMWWFSWADVSGSCQFCDSAGLLTANRGAKPAWYRFNRWTRGDARTVPRASARALRESQ